MISTLGHMLILIALMAAAGGSMVGFVAGYRQSARGTVWAGRAVYVFAWSMFFANLLMIYALLERDFSVSYVAQVGSYASPTWVSVVSLWSSLEGSILFWGAILGAYALVFTLKMRGRYPEYVPYALGVILFVSAFFAMLMAAPANPFRPTPLPIPTDGPGPNPLLQNHLLMVIHPPALYLGYVGMTIPFAIAIAALLRGRLTAGWLKPLRIWTMVPWTFLTIGILLGAWWAYEVLGWGGYWAWDPVENASFLPWLAATGYLHSTVVQERKRMLKVWTLSLVLGSFLLTILGTFMTRSGVFNSVHSFTQSPIGPLFLGFLGFLVVVCVVLLSLRSHLLVDEGNFEVVCSRESAFLLNNILFVVFTFTVLLGTVFPLVNEAVRGEQISVGEPYFDKMAVPIGMLLVFLMGVGPMLPWGRAKNDVVFKRFVLPFTAGLITVAVCWSMGLRGGMTLATFGLCGFATVTTLWEMFTPALERMERRQEGFGSALWLSILGGRRRFGGYVVHLGIVMIVVAVGASRSYRETIEVSVAPGQTFQLNEYTFLFKKTNVVQESNRTVVRAEFDVFHRDEKIGAMDPGLNYYKMQREPVATPHVRTVGTTDVYLSVLSVKPDGSRVGIKAYVFPLVFLLWLSLPVISLGALIALWPRRRKHAVELPEGAGVVAP